MNEIIIITILSVIFIISFSFFILMNKNKLLKYELMIEKNKNLKEFEQFKIDSDLDKLVLDFLDSGIEEIYSMLCVSINEGNIDISDDIIKYIEKNRIDKSILIGRHLSAEPFDIEQMN